MNQNFEEQNLRMSKQKLTLSVETDLVDFARHLGLNLSIFLEERLKELKLKVGDRTECGHRDSNPGYKLGKLGS